MTKLKLNFFIIIIFVTIILLANSKILEEKVHSSELKFLLDYNENENVGIITKVNIYYDPQSSSYNIITGEYDSNAVAYAKYTKSLETLGWDKLVVLTTNNESYSDKIKAYAMGYLEGYITNSRIYSHYLNMRKWSLFDYKDQFPKSVSDFFNENREYVKVNGEKMYDESSYWREALHFQLQVEGILDGYNSSINSSSMKITYEELQLINSNGDIDNIFSYLKNEKKNYYKMPFRELIDYIDNHNHCSVLIKIAPDFSDIFFGHNTWTNYSSMTRIFKEYKFNSKVVKSKTVAFSSYPGAISSIDDFYLTDAGLLVTETTNHVYNEALFEKLSPLTLLSWMRASIANRLTDNGKSWTEMFGRENSGTYNNQFIILDLKKIDLEKREVSDDTLWIVEQLPGMIESEDVTQHLRYNYWPSYNVPYFKSIRDASGNTDLLKARPELKDAIDYDTCARAKIMRRDQGQIKNLQDFKKFMRYNDYKNDSMSKNEPSWTIAARKDLYEDSPICTGATDAKVVSVNDLKRGKIISIISGPSNENQETFDFKSTRCNLDGKTSNVGLPENYNYTWVDYQTELFN